MKKKGDSMSPVRGSQIDLAALLARGNSWHNIPGRDSADFINAALLAMSEPGLPDRRFLAESIIKREQASSTAMGNGLAFPHPLASACDLIGESFVAVTYPRFPILWGVPAGIPVRAAFFVVCGDRHEHLLTLSAFAKLFYRN